MNLKAALEQGQVAIEDQGGNAAATISPRKRKRYVGDSEDSDEDAPRPKRAKPTEATDKKESSKKPKQPKKRENFRKLNLKGGWNKGKPNFNSKWNRY